MAKKPPRLRLERESKLYRLLPGMNEEDRLEASGVLALEGGSCCVVFDNLNRVAWLDISLEGPAENQLTDAPSPGPGFEDIAFDPEARRFFLLIESAKDADGKHRSRVAEYDAAFGYQRCAWLGTTFDVDNRGFEGLAHQRRDGREWLWALCEGNLCTDADEGGGRIQVFERAADQGWSWSHEVAVPEDAAFDDYSAIAISDQRVAIVSQTSARLWCGRLDDTGTALAPEGVVYRFPKGSKYCTVEGVSWLGNDRILAVSDRMKRAQDRACSSKDQSIHIFDIPAG
jgi:hypothetical protein